MQTVGGERFSGWDVTPIAVSVGIFNDVMGIALCLHALYLVQLGCSQPFPISRQFPQ